uniref:Uncharacterized protein n=1 Tax=Synechococcus elongatus (strain ATCC 33912 / PCC 7942 / FACHB-805) TaxID=1140 RepID=Q53574_SYNE7|nr:hypothetical protein [Synechococcus elongatus]pir/S20529/ hypothetical protein D - Synechococcus sp. (strain PCC 7942) plasmid pUH24 [Synechococcus sp.]AAB21873.1 unknown [Synechococcus elongatus PCC 7942 = FACHB-805]
MAESQSLPEFARANGVAPQAIHQAIAAGRITSVWKVGSRWHVDPVAAAREWAANTDPSRIRNDGGGRGKRREPPSAEQLEARRLKAHYRAELLRLDVEERERSLVDAEDIASTWAAESKRVIDRFATVPAACVRSIEAVTGELPPEKREAIAALLQRDVSQALEPLSGVSA